MFHITFRAGEVTPPPAPSIQYYWVLQDDMIPGYVRPAQGKLPGAPAVFRLEEHLPVVLSETRQRYWFNLNRSGDWGVDYRAFMQYTDSHKAFTNNTGILNHGVQVGRDYVGNTGANLPDPKMFPLICARNVISGTEVKLMQKVGALRSGTWALRVNAISDFNEPITHDTRPDLIHVATNILFNKKAPDGYWQVNAFPERGGREGYPVYYPVFSNSKPLYYPLNQLKKLPLGSPLPSAYNPA